MTIEDGSSLSQSQTHLKVLENLIDGDAKRLAYVVNNQLIPCMVDHGFPLQGMRFAWDESIDYTPEQQMEYEKMVSDRYEVDPQYFADKYNMPVGERLQQAFLSEEGRASGSEERRTKSNESEERRTKSNESEERRTKSEELREEANHKVQTSKFKVQSKQTSKFNVQSKQSNSRFFD